MKYGILINDYDKQSDLDKYITNIGSIAMAMALENILYELNVKKEDIVYINYKDISNYSGEYIILLINMHWMQDTGNRILFGLSPKIKPVFLSLSLNDTTITDEQALLLRRYEPIGCRDDRTMHILRAKNIDAYVLGCLTATFNTREIELTQTKVFFCDVPYGVKKYIPESIKKDIVFVKHELDVERLPSGMTPRNYAAQLMERYKTEARLVVTSRFHGVLLALAFGIPVILVNENFTFRFSSVRNLIPLYTREEFSDIDWNPKRLNIEPMKARMKSIAKKRILEFTEKYSDLCEQSSQLEFSKWESARLIDYYDDAIDFIENNWDVTQEIRYAIWGINNNAEAIYSYICKEYPKACLTEIYDTFKEVSFHGIKSIKPDNIEKNANLFIFVTTFVAGYFAEELFIEKGIAKERYFICKRRYITESDLIDQS